MSDQRSENLPTAFCGKQEASGFGAASSTPENTSSAEVVATEAGQQIARDCSHLDRRARLRIVSTFCRQLIPPRKPGRKRRKEITAAHVDWRLGMRGVELYSKHIPGFDRMSRWRRESECRDLMDAIRSRERRSTKQEHVDLSSRG
jgi:hypothetical protein